MKRITIDVEDNFDATADEIMEMFLTAQVGLVYGVQVEDLPEDPVISVLDE